MSPVAEVLRAARAKIKKRENWTQGALARNRKGWPVPPGSKCAVCWCASGSMFFVTEGPFCAFQELLVAMNTNITDFNDTHTHAEVLAAFDKAIAVAEAVP